MKAIHKDFVGIYENAFPKEYCDYLINKGNVKLNKGGKERSNNQVLAVEDLHDNIADVITEKDYDFFHDTLRNVMGHYANKYRCIDSVTVDGYYIVDFKFQKTEPSQGYHVFHSEFSWREEYIRRWGVWTVYLNDIEEGGETEFLYQNLRVKPKVGSICIFPAYYTHTHRGNPPLKGTKYILTGWFLYPELGEVQYPLLFSKSKENKQ